MLIDDMIPRDVNESVGQQCVMCGFVCSDLDEQGVFMEVYEANYLGYSKDHPEEFK